MPDQSYNQTGQGFAQDLAAAREIQQEFLRETGETMSRKEALEIVREDRQKQKDEHRNAEQALREAQPQFLKDGKGIRGQQQEGKNQQIANADGKGNDMQVRRPQENREGDRQRGTTTTVCVHVDGTRFTEDFYSAGNRVAVD